MKNKANDHSGIMILLAAAGLIAAIALIVVGVSVTSENAKIEIVAETTASETVSETTKTKPVTTKITTTTAETTITTTEETTVTTAPETEETTSVATSATTEQTEADTTTESETTETTEAPEDDTYEKSHFANDLFIGDSIYTGLYLYEYFPQEQVFAKIGMNPQSARTVEINGKTAAATVKSMHPTRIFIMLGTNGLAYMDASYMASNMKALVDELHEQSPETSIYIVSIPPVTYEHELKGQETMAMVSKYNSELENAAENCEATYLDLCAKLKNEKGYFSSLYAEADGMHFLGAAYKRMLSFFYKQTQ